MKKNFLLTKSKIITNDKKLFLYFVFSKKILVLYSSIFFIFLRKSSNKMVSLLRI